MMEYANAKLYPYEVNNKVYSVLKIPSCIENRLKINNDIFNLIMADVSSSMIDDWYLLVEHWNNIVSPLLEGE